LVTSLVQLRMQPPRHLLCSI